MIASRRHRFVPLAFAAALAALSPATPAAAWHTTGHAKVARAGVAALPAGVPEFFRAGADAIGQAAIDPDAMKDRTTVQLRAFEYPEHYVDLEVLGGTPLPEDRYGLLPLMHEKQLTPREVGFVPYAVTEGVQRLTIAFAEHRRWPADTRLQQRILVYAGLLAHYAADLQQPLHTSLHHDGRALPDGTSPESGIHNLVDALFDTVPLDAAALTRDLPVRDLGEPWPATLAALAASHALVDEVYRLEDALRQSQVAGRPTAAVTAFTEERFRATASFLASLYHTAWQRSAAIQFPAWHQREQPPPAPPAEGAVIILRPRPQ